MSRYINIRDIEAEAEARGASKAIRKTINMLSKKTKIRQPPERSPTRLRRKMIKKVAKALRRLQDRDPRED